MTKVISVERIDEVNVEPVIVYHLCLGIETLVKLNEHAERPLVSDGFIVFVRKFV